MFYGTKQTKKVNCCYNVILIKKKKFIETCTQEWKTTTKIEDLISETQQQQQQKFVDL